MVAQSEYISSKIHSQIPFKGLLIGGLRKQLHEDTVNRLEEVINKKYGKLDEMYVLIYTNWDNVNQNTIVTKLILLKQCPPPMMGTICIHVDYKKGHITELYVSPLDRPIDDSVIMENVSQKVLSSTQMTGSKIIH